MDLDRLDHLARSLVAAGSRRSLLGLVGFVPVVGGLLDIVGPTEADAAGRRQRRKKRHKHGKGRKRTKRKPKKKCTPLTTCPAGTICGVIDDGCGGRLTCGSCANPTPACVEKVCASCTSSDQCPSGTICDEGLCVTCNVCAAGCTHTTVQAAITAASAGDTIYICPGTYTRIVESPGFFIGKSLTLIGAGNGANGTILDGEGGPSGYAVVSLQGPATIALQDLTVTGGNTLQNAGIEINFNAAASLTRVNVTGNTATGRGGGVGNYGTLTFDVGTAVTQNTSGSFGAGGVFNIGTLTVKAGAVVRHNAAQGPGGGILNKGTLILQPGSDVSDNDPDQCVNDTGTGCPS